MSSSKPLTRLAFRPLSSRCHVRHASQQAKPAIGSFKQAILDSMVQKKERTARTEQALGARRGPVDAILRRNRESNRLQPPSRLQSIVEHSAKEKQREAEEAARQPFTKAELERQMTRQWRFGDVYSPHDLSGAEMAKNKQVRRMPYPNAKKHDIIDQLGIDPVREYKNFALLADFVTETGRIKHRRETGLRPVNQRRMAKAVRRAIGLGLMPKTYKHPELLRRTRAYRNLKV